jgi:hypothetical protein
MPAAPLNNIRHWSRLQTSYVHYRKIVSLTLNGNYFSYILARTGYIWWDGVDGVSFVLDQHVEFDILQC